MTNYFYSAKENGFMPSDMKPLYLEAGTWPDDAMEVDEKVFIEFTKTPELGKIRGGGKNGLPAWLDVPAPTHEESVAAADAQKKNIIEEANDYMNSRQWPGKASIGRLKGDDLAQYNLWLDYLDAVDSLDISTAPDIEWPTKPVLS